MDEVIDAGPVQLAAHLARPPRNSTGAGLVLCHGFPAGPRGAATSAQTYPELADRLAAETGWFVLTFNFRGAGSSTGDFSMRGWLDDIGSAVDHIVTAASATGVWLAGSSTGGALAICAAADDERVRGVVTLAAPAGFDGWAADADQFEARARDVGVIRSPSFPPDPAAWAQELREIRPLAAVEQIAPRPLFLIHGADDDVVPVADARVLADAADGAELRVIPGAGHRLRHDPRAVALLIGWMERQRTA